MVHSVDFRFSIGFQAQVLKNQAHNWIHKLNDPQGKYKGKPQDDQDVLNAHPPTNISLFGVIGNNLCCGVSPITILVELNLQYISKFSIVCTLMITIDNQENIYEIPTPESWLEHGIREPNFVDRSQHSIHESHCLLKVNCLCTFCILS